MSATKGSYRYIAFLRAINVGGRNVKMDRLREIFRRTGFSEVETYIASGNVIFSSREPDDHRLERLIETHLEDALGFSVSTFLRTPAAVATIARFSPFAEDAGHTSGDRQPPALSVAFLGQVPGPDARERVAAFTSDVDDFEFHDREIYWRCRTRVSESSFSLAVLERALGAPATVRNITTVRKLAASYAPAAIQG